MTVTHQPAVVSAPMPPAPGPRSWERQIIGGGRIHETCAAWCTADHRADAYGNLEDLTHRGDLVAAEIPVVHHWKDGQPVAVPMPTLGVQIRQDPYSENPRRRQPFAVVELADDYTLDELGPDGLAEVITEAEAQVARMKRTLAQLVQARAEYAATQ